MFRLFWFSAVSGVGLCWPTVFPQLLACACVSLSGPVSCFGRALAVLRSSSIADAAAVFWLPLTLVLVPFAPLPPGSWPVVVLGEAAAVSGGLPCLGSGLSGLFAIRH